MADNDEFIGEFLIEAAENLDQLDRDLVALEADPRNPDRLASIFRTVHTIKGTCGFFGFTKLSTISHHGEHLLGRLRDGQLVFNDSLASLLLELVDAIRTILAAIETTGGEGGTDFDSLCQRLDAAAAGAVGAAGAPERQAEPEPTPPQERNPDDVAAAVAPTETPAETAKTANHLPPEGAAPPEPPAAAAPTPPTPSPAAGRPSPALDPPIRVDVGLLDTIVDLVGELVLARNQLRTAAPEDPVLQGAINRVHAVTGELQEAAMKTRMAPIEQLFSKFPRIVRDLANTCQKQVELDLDGADTELDRTLIEKIRDPLTHLIRNAIDHGIESATVRQAAGKPAAGRLSLRAFHESGQVTIEVEDDGGGIAVEAVRDKAIARGLVSAEEAAAMSAERIFQFIFQPGFSTAQAVTDISGRGVGMDVVRTNIESIGGTVDINSQPGVGTVVRVRVPLTLAIIPALIVTSGGERLAIPQPYVQELVALRAAGETHTIEGLEGAPVLRLRDRLVPVVFMDRWLGLRDWTKRPTSGTVVIVRVDHHEFGLVVDAVTTTDSNRNSSVETTSLWIIVVKPIGSLLAPLGLYSGATVMGDGGVVLILDLRGLAMAADIPARAQDTEQPATAGSPLTQAEADRYLVCETHGGRRIAVPLQQVERLETLRPEQISSAGDRQFAKRGSRLTRLIDPDQLLVSFERRSPPAAASLVGVILTADTGGDALSVARIIDVDRAESDLEPGGGAAGLLGTLLVGGAATEVLDVPAAARWAAHATAP